ncbi:MAG: hypothetical protein KGJ80_14055, partial [Chloroflexota bacterium]|nr:hypothetical protein [Chloroflexota bacterium]
MTELRWYGWGDAAKTYSLVQRPGAWKFLRAALDLQGDEQFPACDFDSIQLRSPRIDESTLREALEADFRSRSTPAEVLFRADQRTRV